MKGKIHLSIVLLTFIIGFNINTFGYRSLTLIGESGNLNTANQSYKQIFKLGGKVEDITNSNNPIPVNSVIISIWSINYQHLEETIYTNESGEFEFERSQGWSGHIIAEKDGYNQFEPQVYDIHNIQNDTLSLDFTCLIQMYEISGKAYERESVGIEFVTIYFVPEIGDTMNTLTNDQGNYLIQLPVGWSGTSYAWKFGYEFDTIYSYDAISESLPDQDFIGNKLFYEISGYITDSLSGGGISSVLIKHNNNILATTSVNGYYSFTSEFGWQGVITPEKYGYLFNPEKIQYDSLTGDLFNQNFTAILKSYKISGKVNKDGVGVDSVKLDFRTTDTLIDNLYFYSNYESSTNDTGYYEITLYHGWQGTITPSKYLHSFTPTERLVSQPLFNNLLQQNFSTTLSEALSVLLEDMEICYGQEAILDPDVSGGSGSYSYIWMMNNSIIGNDPLLTVSPSLTTSYILTVDDGIVSISDTAVVHVNPLPQQAQVFQKEPDICNNQQGARFSTTFLPDHDYLWSIVPAHTGILYADSKGACIVNWNAAATESSKLILKVRNQHDCETQSEHEIVFSAGIAPQLEIIRKGNSNLLFCDSLANATYTWGFSPRNDLMIDNVIETGIKHYCYFNNFNTAINYYWVELETENACKTRIYYNLGVGVVVQKKPGVIVHPVPFNDFLDIHFPEATTGMLNITLSDMVGRTVLNTMIHNNGSISHRLETNMIKPGIYVLFIFSDSNFSYSRKVIKY